MFELTRDLAKRLDVTEIVVPLEQVQRHMLAAMVGRAGVKTCRDDLVRSTVAWGRLTTIVPPIVAALRSADVRVIPIKGVSYATGLYSSPVERPMTDIDVLVEPYAIPNARRVLAELGFVADEDPPDHHASTWVRGDLVIDLHRGIVGTGRSRIDLAKVWHRAGPGWPAGAERLDPHDELVFHLLHMVRNRLCGPLVHVVDAARLAARVGSVEPALARARGWGVGTAADVAWGFVQHVVDDRPRGWLAPRASDVLEVRQPPLTHKLVFDVATAGSPKQFAARTLGYATARFASWRGRDKDGNGS